MTSSTRLSTGLDELDEILAGGVLPTQSYLVRGGPGTGKSTLCLHFLTAPDCADVKTSYITLHESAESLRHNAQQQGFAVEQIDFLDLSPSSQLLSNEQSYTLFSPSEVEGETLTQRIIEHLDACQPKRLVVDSLSHLRYLSPDDFRFRLQVLALQKYLRERKITVFFTSERLEDQQDDLDLQHLADGVFHLSTDGAFHHIRVSKLRGSNFQKGQHAFRLTSRGMSVYPRLIPGRYRRQFEFENVPSGIPSFDELLHGGLERGSITIITGPTGAGKTTLGLQFMKEAAGRGERSVVYAFEEAPQMLQKRCSAINMPIKAMLTQEKLKIKQIEPLHYHPDQFALEVRNEVEEHNVSIVMIDSVAGYRLAMGDETDPAEISERLHALCKYMQNMGVTVILLNEMEQITGEFRATRAGISYLADTIIFFRYFELLGEMRRAVGVLKKRLGDFEKTLRELEITRYGLKVGQPITNLRGVLSGRPEIIEQSLIDQHNE